SFAPYAYMRRAASSFNLKDYASTISDYSRIVREYPTHPAAEESLVPLHDALTLAGRAGVVDSYLATVKRANPDSKGLESVEYETAKNLYFNQQYRPAVTALSAFVQAYPQSPRRSEARYYIAESHYRLGELDEALAIYETIRDDRS